jgi:hypothetical protein
MAAASSTAFHCFWATVTARSAEEHGRSQGSAGEHARSQAGSNGAYSCGLEGKSIHVTTPMTMTQQTDRTNHKR